MGVDLDKAWQAFREKGLKYAVITVVGAVVLAAANKAADNVASDGIDYLWSTVWKPKFLVVFSEPVQIQKIVLLADGTREKQPESVKLKGNQAAEITVDAGYYIVVVHKSPDGNQVLREPIVFKKETSDYRVNSASDRWGPEDQTTRLGGSGAKLVATRWTSTEDDLNLIKEAGGGTAARILTAAIGQLGVSQKDPDAVAAYWAGTSFPNATVEVPWGGALLGWIMRQANVVPPLNPARFTDWETWGTEVPIQNAKPGMVAVFSFPGLAQARSGLLVGIFLRQRADCTEIIAGNIVDRVVVTCVSAKVKSIRTA